MITLKYPGPDPTEGGYFQVQVPYVPGKRVQHYLREARLMSVSLRCRVVDEQSRRPIRMGESPADGASICLLLSGKSMS